MGRIPTYDATVGGRAAPVATLPMNSYAPLNNATAQFGETLGKVFSEHAEKFAEASRTNTVLDEENKMMEHFFSLSEEAKKQEPDQQVKWYQDQSKAYRDEMKTRVGDPKAIKQLENTWQSFTMRGMYQVNDHYRKTIAADGISKAMDGDDAFLKQVYSMYDNPVLLEAGVKDRADAYDKLVAAGHITAAQGQHYKEQITHQVVEGRAAFVVEKNPYQALKMLQDEKEFVDLMPGKRAAYINMAQGEIKRAEALKKQEERERRMEARSYGLELSSFAHRLTEDAIKSNATPSEFGATYRELSKYKGVSPTVDHMIDRMERVGNEVAIVTDVKTMRPEALKAEINAYTAKWESLPVEDREKARTMQKVADNQEKFLKKGQHLEYMDDYHLNGGVTPLAPNSGPDSISRRLAQVNYARDTFGGNPNYLTDAEADTFAKAWKEGDESSRQRIGSVLFRLAGGGDKAAANPSKIDTITKQMHLKEGSIADEVQFMLQGDMKMARLIGEGRKRLENNPDRYGQVGTTLNREINRQIDDLKLGVLDPNDTLRKQWVQGIRNTFVGMAGETTDTVDPTSVEKAVTAYFGPVVETNGNKSLAWADGEDSSGHTQLWRSFTPDVMKAAHGGELPKVRVGSDLRELNFSEVTRKGMAMPWQDGKYVLVMPNKPMPWNDTEYTVAVDAKGKPYTLDLQSVLPDLKRRRDQLYAPYGDPLYTGP